MVRNHHTPPSPDPAGPGTESKIARPFSPTSGPWFVHESTREFEIWTEPKPLESSTAQLIATIWKPEWMFDAEARKFLAESTASNARLIATVPRLLQMLNKFIDEEHHNCAESSGICSMCAVRDEAETLLRELEGGGQ